MNFLSPPDSLDLAQSAQKQFVLGEQFCSDSSLVYKNHLEANLSVLLTSTSEVSGMLLVCRGGWKVRKWQVISDDLDLLLLCSLFPVKGADGVAPAVFAWAVEWGVDLGKTILGFGWLNIC